MTTLPLSDAKSRLSEIAEYRVRYTIDDESRVVTVADISHRREGYC